MSRVMSLGADREDSDKTVLVFGSGVGGLSAAVDLAGDGWSVLLSDPFEQYVPTAGYLSYGGVVGEGSASVESTDLGLDEAMFRAQLIVVSTLATFGTEVVSQMAPAIDDHHIVVAACGGLVSLALEHAMQDRARPLLVEFSCFPYSARFRPGGALNIRRKRPVRLAATDPARTPELAATLPGAWVGPPTESVLHAAILNPNYMVHPAAVVVNGASSDREEAVPHEGLTPGARRLAAGLDSDKCALLAAMGLPEVTLVQVMDEMTRDGSAANTPGQETPEPMLDRYLTEDCGMGLSLLENLAEAAGVSVPTITAIREVLAVTYPDKLPEFPFEAIGCGLGELVRTAREGGND